MNNKRTPPMTVLKAAMVLPLVLFLVGSQCENAGDSRGEVAYDSALVVTTDYVTGSYGAVSMDSHAAVKDIGTLHPDLTCRFDPITQTPFIIQRMGGDAIDVLSPEDLSIVNEYSTGAGTNPHDIAVVSADRAYVTLYGSSELLIVHPMTGEQLGTVNLSAYADADGLPEMDGMFVHDGKVYVFLARLDPYWVASDVGLVVVIEGGSGDVLETLPLSATNPYEQVNFSSAIEKLVIAYPGDFSVMDDGGIEYFDPTDHSLSGLVVNEADFGGNVTIAVVATQEKGYAMVAVPGEYGSDTHIIKFHPETGENLGSLLEAKGWIYSAMALSPDGSELWISDGTPESPGIRIFNVEDDEEITDSAINLGLPPGTICFTGQ